MPVEHEAITLLRKQFPILQQSINGHPLVYLDNAATSQKPQTVLNCLQRYYTETNANVHRGSHTLSNRATALYEEARQRVAHFINAPDSREVIWTRGTTEGINLVANSWGQQLREGDEIILSTLEHHANIVPWQMLAQRCGAIIKVIPLDENGDLNLQSYHQLLSSRTRLVAVTHISNVLGTINPLQEIISSAHNIGAKVLVDGAQAVSHLPVDIQALDADFYVFSGHKVFAPTGIGVLWAKADILQDMPPWQGGGEMIRKVSFSGTEYNDLPFRFEAGTPDIGGAIALGEALHWLGTQDRSLLLQHENQLMQYALDGCQQVKGFQRIGNPSESASLFSFALHNQHPHDVGLFLDQQGIAVRSGHHCAMPLMEALQVSGTLRASFTFYNTHADVESLVDALEKINHIEKTSVASPAIETPNSLEQLTALKGWNNRYRQIMQWGNKLAPMADSLKTTDNLIAGCESLTWVSIEKQPDKTLHFVADSEARVIRGLISLILTQVQNKTAAEIRQVDFQAIFNQLELERHLSQSRGNGLRAVLDKINQVVCQPDATEL